MPTYLSQPGLKLDTSGISLDGYDTTRPIYLVEFGLSFAPTYSLAQLQSQDQNAAYNWTIIPGVQHITITRGRQNELGKIEAGRATLIIDNTSGNLSPENTASIYYPYLAFSSTSTFAPMIPIRIRCVWLGTTYYLFYGFTKFRPIDPSMGRQTVTIQATDLFLKLNRLHMEDITPGAQKAGARLAQMLSNYGHLADFFVFAAHFDTGVVTLASKTYSSVSDVVLPKLEDVCFAESGIFFVAGNGDLVFHDQSHRTTVTRSTVSQVTIGGSAGGSIPFREGGMAYEYVEDYMLNRVFITPSGFGGAAQQSATTYDDLGQSYELYYTFGALDLSQSSDLFQSNADAKTAALLKLTAAYQAKARVTSLAVEDGGLAAATTWILGAEIADRITAVRTFPGSFGLNRDFWIEGYTRDIDLENGGHHTIALNLSAVAS